MTSMTMTRASDSQVMFEMQPRDATLSSSPLFLMAIAAPTLFMLSSFFTLYSSCSQAASFSAPSLGKGQERAARGRAP